jgi:hypothetical protein
MDETLKAGSLTRLWPIFSRTAFGLYLIAALGVAAAGWLRLISRPTQLDCAVVLFAIGIGMALIEAVLKRLGYIEKDAKPVSLDEEAPRQPEPPPITQPAEVDPYAEPEKAFEETLTPLGGGALPGRFDRQGRKAVWRVAQHEARD